MGCALGCQWPQKTLTMAYLTMGLGAAQGPDPYHLRGQRPERKWHVTSISAKTESCTLCSCPDVQGRWLFGGVSSVNILACGPC